MGAINRYTRLTNAEFDPFSFQEQMMLPAYKRKQHDALDASIAQIEGNLAKVDPLDVHSELAKQEQERLYNQLTSQRDKLASEGFNQNNKNNLLKLNKDYQDSIGTMGTIGKINNAKKQFELEKKNYLNNAVKLGYSPEQATVNWQKHAANYKNNFNGSDITNIDSYSAPEYINAVDKATTLFKSARLTSTDIVNLGKSSIITKDPRGQYVITRKGSEKYASNITQLQAAVDYMKNQILNSNSPTNKSIIHQGKDPNNVLNEISGLANVFMKDATAKSSGSTITNFKPNNPLERDGFNTRGALTVTNSSYVVPEYSRLNYSDLKNKIENLSTSEKLDGLKSEELYKLKQYKKALDSKLSKDPSHSQLLKDLEQFENDELNLRKGILPTKNYNSILPSSWDIFNKEGDSKTARDLADKYISQSITDIKNKLDVIKSKHADNIQLTSTNYTISPVTTKDQSKNKIFNKSIGDIITSNPQALLQNTTINGLITTNGITNITSNNDKKGISNLFYKADPNNIKVVGFTPKGIDGKPEYTLKVNTKKDNKYDLDGVLGSGNENIGDGEPVTIKVSFSDTNNGLAKNVNGYLQNYIVNNGGERGLKLVQSMNINSAITKYKGSSWNDLISNDVISNDNSLKQIYKSKMKDLISTGLTSQEAFDKLKTEKLYE